MLKSQDETSVVSRVKLWSQSRSWSLQENLYVGQDGKILV